MSQNAVHIIIIVNIIIIIIMERDLIKLIILATDIGDNLKIDTYLRFTRKLAPLHVD